MLINFDYQKVALIFVVFYDKPAKDHGQHRDVKVEIEKKFNNL